MRKKRREKSKCQLCGSSFAMNGFFPAAMVRPAISKLILQDHADCSDEGFVCHVDLNKFRSLYVGNMLATERGELSYLETDVLESLRQHETLAVDVNSQFDQSTSLGDRLSDRLATFGGSWRFLVSFACVLTIWIIINSLLFKWRPFDP